MGSIWIPAFAGKVGFLKGWWRLVTTLGGSLEVQFLVRHPALYARDPWFSFHVRDSRRTAPAADKWVPRIKRGMTVIATSASTLPRLRHVSSLRALPPQNKIGAGGAAPAPTDRDPWIRGGGRPSGRDRLGPGTTRIGAAQEETVFDHDRLG